MHIRTSLHRSLFLIIPVGTALAQPPTSHVELQPRLFTTSPESRTEFIMGAFGGGLTALHGGYNMAKSHVDTWTVNGGWVDKTPATGPGAIEYGAMAVDLARGMGVSFGGQDEQRIFRQDTDLLALSLAADAFAPHAWKPRRLPPARLCHATATNGRRLARTSSGTSLAARAGPGPRRARGGDPRRAR